MGTDRKRRHRCWLCCFASLALAVIPCGPRDAAASTNGRQLIELLAVASQPEQAQSLSSERARRIELERGETELLESYHHYLLGEVRSARDEPEPARSLFAGVVRSAAASASEGGRGAGAIAGFALHRWQQLLLMEKSRPKDEIRTVLRLEKELAESGVLRGLYWQEVLESVPQLETDLARQSAALANLLGDAGLAEERFLAYLRAAERWEPTPAERKALDGLYSEPEISRERLGLFLGRRLIELKRPDEASHWLQTAAQSDNYYIRSEALLLLSQIQDRKSAAIRLLGEAIRLSPDDSLVQDALLRRAMWHLRRPTDEAAYRSDLLAIAEQYSGSYWVNEANYRLARNAERRGRMADAFSYFARVRDNARSPRRRASSYFFPALLRYAAGDLEHAAALLESLERELPRGELHSHGLFWHARIREEQGRSDQARLLFTEAVASAPFSYYGVRARMHLAEGRGARTLAVPSEATQAALRGLWTEVAREEEGAPLDARRDAVLEALASGFYARAREAATTWRRAFPDKLLSEIPLLELQRSHVYPALAVFLALRQDARLAAAAADRPGDAVALSQQLVDAGGDAPIGVEILRPGNTFKAYRSRYQAASGYLRAAYPVVYADQLRQDALSHDVSPSLLYAVIFFFIVLATTEFYTHGALGLFQFTPRTFRDVASDWRVLEENDCGVASPRAFLMDPDCSIAFGARWFGERLLPKNGGEFLQALIEHQAGEGAVAQSERVWRTLPPRLAGDLEYRIESATAGRNFLRAVARDLAIAESTGLYRGVASLAERR